MSELAGLSCPVCGGGMEVELTGGKSFRARCVVNGCDMGMADLAFVRWGIEDVLGREYWR